MEIILHNCLTAWQAHIGFRLNGYAIKAMGLSVIWLLGTIP